MTVSNDTYVANLLSLVGRAERLRRRSRSGIRRPRPSEALARSAQVQIFASEPYPFSEEKHGELTAKLFGTAGHRIFVDGDDYCWHGVRTLEGLKAVESLIKYGN